MEGGLDKFGVTTDHRIHGNRIEGEIPKGNQHRAEIYKGGSVITNFLQKLSIA